MSLQQGQYNEPPEGEQDINHSSLGYLSELYLISLDRVENLSHLLSNLVPIVY